MNRKKNNLERELRVKKIEAEENIGKRVAEIKLQEDELKELRKENYTTNIEKAIEDTRAETIKQLETKYKYESQLKAKIQNQLYHCSNSL